MIVVTDIAEAIKDGLDGETFSLPFTPTREFSPSFDLEELATLRVAVVPRGLEDALAGRGLAQQDVRVDIGVMKKLDDVGPTDVDPLVSLVEEIVEYLRKRDFNADETTACWLRTEVPTLYSHEHLNENRQFTSVVTATYRVITAA